MKSALLSLAAAAFAATAALAAPQVPAGVQTFETDMGFHFINKDGHTLYVYDGDEKPLKSTCVNACAKAWPPLAAEKDAQSVGEWSTFAREDGSQQWAFRGRPVYAFATDPQPRATLGDGVLNVWHIAIALKPRPPGVKFFGTPEGRVAIDPAGRTLYTRASGECVKDCLKDWAPYVAPEAAVGRGDWSVVVRKDDQSPQWAYKGRPVYAHRHDVNAGDRRGEADKAWRAVLVQAVPALPPGVTVSSSDYGPIFADAKGLTLYSIGDIPRTKKEATCDEACIQANWIPLMAGANDQPVGNWSLMDLSDGKKQWAYRAQPVYRYVNDKIPGEINGDNFANGSAIRGGWRVIPQASLKEEPL